MSYFEYKPVNKRFKEFVGILLATGMCAFLGGAVAVLRLGGEFAEIKSDQAVMGQVLNYAVVGAVVGLVLGAVIVNSSRKSGE